MVSSDEMKVRRFAKQARWCFIAFCLLVMLGIWFTPEQAIWLTWVFSLLTSAIVLVYVATGLYANRIGVRTEARRYYQCAMASGAVYGFFVVLLWTR
jgi:hypothetical protein